MGFTRAAATVAAGSVASPVSLTTTGSSLATRGPADATTFAVATNCSTLAMFATATATSAWLFGDGLHVR